MKFVYESYPAYTDKQFSICDMKIDGISFCQDVVRFSFSNGFYLINKDETIRNSSYIEFKGCSVDDFNCYIIKRKKGKNGARCRIIPLSLVELSKKLYNEKKSIEIDLELYDISFLHWRGELFPYKKRGLSDVVVIETMEQILMCCTYGEKQ